MLAYLFHWAQELLIVLLHFRTNGPLLLRCSAASASPAPPRGSSSQSTLLLSGEFDRHVIKEEEGSPAEDAAQQPRFVLSAYTLPRPARSAIVLQGYDIAQYGFYYLDSHMWLLFWGHVSVRNLLPLYIKRCLDLSHIFIYLNMFSA